MTSPRLNPFAFVADTGLRFGLLIVFTTAAAVRRWIAIGLDWADPEQRSGHCLGERIGPALDEPLMDERWEAVRECLSMALPAAAPAVALGLALLLTGSAVAYWLHPGWRVRRLRLVPLDASDMPDLAAALDALCRDAGLARAPEFWWNPLDSRVRAVAFGRLGRHRVGLTGGAAARFYADPAAFRVLLLHELAHIRNGDVGIAFFTLSVWWAFVATALLPGLVLAVALARPTAADIALLVMDLMLVGAGVLLTRNAVLRARELYADVRVLSWEADEAALQRAFDTLRPIRGLGRLASPHPAPDRRRQLLISTDAMFRFGAWDAFGTGIAAAQGAILFFLGTALAVGWEAGGLAGDAGVRVALTAMTSVALPALGAAAVVSIVTWRATFVALVRSATPTGAVRTACALAAGTVLGGPVLYLAGGVAGAAGAFPGLIPPGLGTPMLAAAALALAAVLFLALSAMLVPFLRWVEAGATAWLAEALRGPRPGPSFWIGIAMSCALAAPWLAGLGPLLAGAILQPVMKHGPTGLLSAHVYLGSAGVIFPVNILVWTCFLWLWAFPMSAAAMRLWRHRRRQEVAPWPFLVPGLAEPSTAPTSPLHPGRAVLAGAACGLTVTAAMAWMRVPVSVEQARLLGVAAPGAYATFLSVTLTAVAAQGLAGAVAALAVPRLGVVHGLLSSLVAGSILLAAAAIYLMADGITTPGPVLVKLMISPVLLGGWVAAFVCASVAAAVRSAVVFLMHRHQ